MRKVHVIGNSLSFRDFHHPLRVFKNELRKLDLEVTFFYGVNTQGIEECDVLIFHEDNYRDMLPIQHKNRDSALEFLQRFFEKFPYVIWFDGNDGSGGLRSYVFPYINIYAKSQIMKDLGYYQQKHATGEIHRDYVIENFHLKDPMIQKEPITEYDSKKIRISWSRMYRNWHSSKIPYIKYFLEKFPAKEYHFKYMAPNLSKRSNTIQYRVNYWETIQTINWWRTQTQKYLEDVLQNIPSFQLLPYGKASLRKYTQELENSIVTVSPFGINELCYRDFWSFITGSLLFKTNMDHLSTYPDIYKNGMTYVAHSWDFSDFNEKLEAILTFPERYEAIAQEAQDQFKKAMTDGMRFAHHFYDLISS